MTYGFPRVAQGLETISRSGGLHWGHQLSQRIAEWQHGLIVAGSAPCPAGARVKAIMGMMGRAVGSGADSRTGQVEEEVERTALRHSLKKSSRVQVRGAGAPQRGMVSWERQGDEEE